jgi:hypothetical protein
VIYILIIIITTLLREIFQLSFIGNYTDIALILIGLYLFTLFVAKQEICNKKIALFVFTAISLVPILFQLVILSKNELYFSSPNNTNTLVIVERSSLLDGYSSIYEKKYVVFKKPVNWNRINGLNNFSSGSYTIEWVNEKIAIMKYEDKHYGQINLE